MEEEGSLSDSTILPRGSFLGQNNMFHSSGLSPTRNCWECMDESDDLSAGC